MSKTRQNITRSEMRDLFVNNEGLATIGTHLQSFNPFCILGVENYELRHTSMLAWLMDPKETHGFGQDFLRSLLAETFRSDDETARPSSLDIVLADLSSVEIRREKDNIDLLLECSKNNWIFLFENKFWSSQHGGQLKRYKKWLESDLKRTGRDRKPRFVFLTLNEEEPEDEAYATLSYDTICHLLKAALRSHLATTPTDVRDFINHYITILEDATGMSTSTKDMERLAKELYREHRRVIDYVVEHGQNSDFGLAAESITGDIEWLDTFKVGNRKFVHGHIGKRQFSFLPRAWYKALGEDEHDYKGCEDWWSGYPVICWFQLNEDGSGKGDLRLYAEVGPLSDPTIRSSLIEAIIEKAGDSSRIKFQSGAAEPGRKYSKFFTKNKVTIKDTSDTDALTSAMEKMMREFGQEFDLVGKALTDIGRNEDAIA